MPGLRPLRFYFKCKQSPHESSQLSLELLKMKLDSFCMYKSTKITEDTRRCKRAGLCSICSNLRRLRKSKATSIRYVCVLVRNSSPHQAYLTAFFKKKSAKGPDLNIPCIWPVNMLKQCTFHLLIRHHQHICMGCYSRRFASVTMYADDGDSFWSPACPHVSCFVFHFFPLSVFPPFCSSPVFC